MDDEYLKKCIDLLDSESSGKVVTKKVDDNKRLDLIVRFERLIIQTKTEKEKLYKHYKVENNTEMSDEQLEDAIKVMEKKLWKVI